MKKMITLMLVLVMVACAAGASATKIGICQLVEHNALAAAGEGFMAALQENGYADAEIIYENAQGDQANIATIADSFIAGNVDLIFAIATPVAQTMAAKTVDIPIIGSAITDYEVAKLVESNEVPGYNVSGTSDMNPVAAQVDMAKTFAPDAKTIGFLYCSAEDNSILQIELAKAEAEAIGLDWVEITVSNSSEVQQAVQQIVTECDVIYIPTDNVFASAMPIVYGVTVESQIPVICGEANMVMAGGLATIGVDYYTIGYQAGLMAIDVLEGADITTMPVQMPEGGTLTINATVAAEIGVEIPADMVEFAVEME